MDLVISPPGPVPECDGVEQPAVARLALLVLRVWSHHQTWILPCSTSPLFFTGNLFACLPHEDTRQGNCSHRKKVTKKRVLCGQGNMHSGKSRLWLGGALLLCLTTPGIWWVLRPAPAVYELRQRTRFFPTRFPLRLTQSGQYRLMSDLIVPDRDVDAIQIMTYEVTLDLNGFTIAGPGHGGSGRGISTEGGDHMNLTIRNGTVCGFGRDGVQLPGVSQRVENVRAMKNGGDGFEIGPRSALVRNQSLHNGGSGLNVGRGESCIHENTIQGNFGHGINGGATSEVSRNLIEDNQGEGIFVTVGSVVRNNIIRRSGRNGMLLGSFVVAEENEVHASQAAGIATYGKSNRLIKNALTQNYGPGAQLDGPDNYTAQNVFQGNAAGALGGEADDRLGRDDEANEFLP